MNILITAYAVNPYKGSEDATGWNIPLELAAYHRVTVITRLNNREAIEQYMAEKKDERFNNLNFFYFDLSEFSMRWKKRIGERGYVLYYYLWQKRIPTFIKNLDIPFDICHTLNFHSDSHPQFLWKLGKPVFWGPIGHHAPVKKSFINGNSPFKSFIKDRLYAVIKFTMRTLNPYFYISKNTAEKIFIINSSIVKKARIDPSKAIVLPAVATDVFSSNKSDRNNDIFRFISVGRLMYMKGFDLVIAAFAKMRQMLPEEQRKKVILQIVGKGEDKEYLTQMAARLQLNDAMEFIEWVEKDQMKSLYENANVFAFGSHEGAGMVVPEALAMKLPVICLDNYGPGELCDLTNALKVKVSNFDKTATLFAEGMLKLFTNETYYNKLKENCLPYAKENFTWSHKAEIISKAYCASTNK